MNKLFETIKALRPLAKKNMISRDEAIAQLEQATGMSGGVIESAVNNMFKGPPSQAPGISNLEFNAPKVKGSSKSATDEINFEMAIYNQKLQKLLEPYYDKYGAKSALDRKFLSDFFDASVYAKKVAVEPSDSKYLFSDIRTYLSESTEGAVPEDVMLDIVYGKDAKKFAERKDMDGFIKHAKDRFKEEGVEINDKMLNKVRKELYIGDKNDEAFATGGRVGFKKGLSKALIDKLNEIAPGSTAVGKTTKGLSEKALRNKTEREMFRDFNKKYPQSGVEKGTIKVDPSEYPVDFNKNEFKPKQKGKFTKAEVLIARMKSSIKEMPEDEYVQNVFPSMIKELEDKPSLANNETVWNVLSGDLPENQRFKVYDDNSVDFEILKPTHTFKLKEDIKRKLNSEGGLNYLMGIE